MSKTSAQHIIDIAGLSVYPGENKRIEIPVARLPTQTWVSVPVQVIHGAHPGPTLALISGIHGDEINGMEVIRELLPKIDAQKLHGTLLLVPVVNVFGFLNGSRYLPDRRDLNRCFPGSDGGSMASRLAHLFTQEIIKKADYAIDFHTAATGRINEPQIRANIKSKKIVSFVNMFGQVPVVHSSEIDGSLRATARKHRCTMMVFEGGEANRFNNQVIQEALEGTVHVLKKLNMIKVPGRWGKRKNNTICKKSKWLRASRSGLFRLFPNLGDAVKAKQKIGVISNIFGDPIRSVKAPFDGLIIGVSTDPKVNQGDGMIHLAQLEADRV
jgi:predicted deacylase